MGKDTQGINCFISKARIFEAARAKVIRTLHKI